MLNLRLVQPRLLIDITGIPEMTRVEDADDAITFGACITTANMEDGRLPAAALRRSHAWPCRSPIARCAIAAPSAAACATPTRRQTGFPPFAHSAPECLISGGNGRRSVPAAQFVTGAYENVLAAGEMLEAIKIPRLSPQGRFGYHKICRKVGEFALAMGAVLDDPERGQFRIVIGATKGRPIVIAQAREVTRGDKTLDENALRRVLAQHNVADSMSQRQQIAAVTRAYAQAMAP